MKREEVYLGKGCIVCGAGAPPIVGARCLSDEQKRFFGVPARPWVVEVCFLHCEQHLKQCYGNGDPSGFPRGDLLIPALQKAVANYDWRAEPSRRQAEVAEASARLDEVQELMNSNHSIAALALATKVCEVIRANVGDRSEDGHRANELYLSLLLACEKYGRAGETLIRLRDMRQSLFPKNQTMQANTDLYGARVAFGLGRMDEAEAKTRAALANGDQPTKDQAKAILVDILEATNRGTEAANLLRQKV